MDSAAGSGGGIFYPNRQERSAWILIPARYRWLWQQPNEELARDWSVRLNIPLLAARVLVSRGFAEDEASALFQPAEADSLEDPMRLKGMAAAVERIRRAISHGERIRVYGDYDADGVTSTALMHRLLTRLGATFDTYIPHRSLEGYGMNPAAVDLAAEAGVNLILTVDNGISAVEQIAYARTRGIDVVVTDHHEPPAELPIAAALVNPKQPGCDYPNKGLCGAGVAFKLAHALLGRPVPEWSDLAAIGTIADLMPLVGENRLIVRMGLARIRREPAVGIRALAAVCKTEPADLTSGRIGFALGPRLNAGGRLDRADGAVRLLTTDDPAEAESLAQELDRLNAQRQRMVETTIEEAERMWQEKRQEGRKVIVLSSPGWHAGIAGLVASKLVERHYLPAIVLAEDPDTGLAKGSARSIDGFDLHAALTACSELMEHFGGHQAAAGMTIRTDRLAQLEEKLHQWAEERLQPEDWLPKKHADLACSLEEMTLDAAEALGRLEPFGNGHPVPRLMVEGAVVRECRLLGKEGKHVRLTVAQSGRVIEAVGFGMGGIAESLTEGRELDLLGELAVNEWNGRRKAQFTIQDLRSDEWRWIDRRDADERETGRQLKALAAEAGEGLRIGCAAARMAEQLSPLADTYGSTVFVYGDAASTDAPDARESAAARESEACTTGGSLPKLVLIGLPASENGIRSLAHLLLDGAGWAAIYLFADRTSTRKAPHVLKREDFARVYKRFREQGAWDVHNADFLHETAKRTGLPQTAIELAEKVFLELGFIRASGDARTVEADPPRRSLEDSPRYRRMLRDAEVSSFSDWPLEWLKSWGKQLRGDGLMPIPEKGSAPGV